MLLNVGCGDDYRDGWVNVDSAPLQVVRSDVQAFAHHLPFPDDTFVKVYASHILEHIPLNQVCTVLAELRRVAKPGAPICVVTPDMAKLTEDHTVADWNKAVFGTQRWMGDYHEWTPTGSVVEWVMKCAGWDNAAEHDIYEDSPIVREWKIRDPNLGWQCCVIATKSTEGSK